MSKKTFTSLIVAFILIFVVVNGWMILKNRPPRVDFRLTLIPLQTDLPLQESEWMGNALWTMVARNLQASVEDNAIIAPAEWISEIAAMDTIYHGNNFKKFDNKNKNEYFLLGKIESVESLPNLKFELIRASDNAIDIRDSLLLTLQELPEISKQISHRILAYFNLNLKETDLYLSFVSSQSYQDFIKAQRFYCDRDYESAIKSAQKAIVIDSNLIDAYLLIGKSYFMSGVKRKELGESPVEEFEAARDWLSRTIAKDSTQSEAGVFLSEYYIYQERWSVAEDLLSRAFQLNPNIPRLYLVLSRLHEFRYRKLGFKNEEELFQRALFINPRYEDGYLVLADFYLFNNRRQAAIAVLEHYLAINPNSVPALMALGKIYLIRNDIVKIIEIFNRVLELQPKNADAYYNLGILYYNTEDYETAEKFFLRAIDLNNHVNANLYLAYLYEAKGNYEKAIEFLRRRIRFRKGPDDEFAEEARKHLFKLMHGDSTANISNEKTKE
ncbi:MAG TPA: tetratricopeptide repeat protein [bacterium]